jgi:broad specificity phosphatase PhoE
MNKRNVIIHFIRHAESTANKAAEKNINEYNSEKWFDAELTSNGIEQAKNLKKINIKPDLVYSSPFRRTFMTLYYSIGLYNVNNIHNSNIPILIDSRIGEIQNGHPCNYNNYYSSNINSRPIESEKDLINRGELWFNDMITYIKDKPNIKNIFIYTHGVFMYEFLNNSSFKFDHNCQMFPQNTQICSVNISKFL